MLVKHNTLTTDSKYVTIVSKLNDIISQINFHLSNDPKQNVIKNKFILYYFVLLKLAQNNNQLDKS